MKFEFKFDDILNLNSNLSPKFYWLARKTRTALAQITVLKPTEISTARKSKFNQICAKQVGLQKSALKLSLFGSNLSF